MSEDRLAVVKRFYLDKWQAHDVLFRHRHMRGQTVIEAAPFHREMVADFWSRRPYSIVLAFRGSGKSTLAEEDIVLAVSFRSFHNILIVGSSEGRAAERLAVVAYELANNPGLGELFGDQRGSVWTQTKLVTSHNVCVQAMGRDQDIRGIKYLDWRPDLVVVDDFEDRETVQTPEGRGKTLRWFLGELLPACAAERKVRVRATPMDAESVPMRLSVSGWPTLTFPVEHVDEAGARAPTWPAAHPLEWIDRERPLYERLGQLAVWDREYMCEAKAASEQVFRESDIKVVPRVRTWEAVYAMIDPARTVSRTSASTGWAVWSWVERRLIVWAAGADMLLPDEIVALAFDLAERFDPVWIGVEADGLNEWLLQPLRQEGIKRGQVVPIRGVKAPRGKLDFIRGLQPFFAGGEAVLAQDLPALREQLLNFPRGRIDAPNALAYALTMRPGLAIYEAFSQSDHVVERPSHNSSRPLFLAGNATGAMTSAALCQAADGRLSILADWIVEGNPGEAVAQIAAEAGLAAESVREGEPPRPRVWTEALKAAAPQPVIRRAAPAWIVPRRHAQPYQNVGLMQAIRAYPGQVSMGGAEDAGRLWLADQLGRTIRQQPAVAVAAQALWTARAFAGGYCKAMKRGQLQEEPEDGPYRLLMEGIESFCGAMRARQERDDEAQPWAYDRSGRRYKSAMPERAR